MNERVTSLEGLESESPFSSRRSATRVAEAEGHIVGMATLSLRYHLGLGGLLPCLDELAVAPDAPKGADRALLQATVGRARSLGAVRVVKDVANQGTPPRRGRSVPPPNEASGSEGPHVT